MKKLIFIIISMISFTAFSQNEEQIDPKTQKELQREARKAEKAEKLRNALILTNKMVNERRFVLEANQLSNRTGTLVNVNPSINFVSIDSNHCIIQLAPNIGIGGNGLGGVTTDGSISSYKVTKNKKGDNFTIDVFANTTLGAFDLVFFIDAEGNTQANVTQSTTGILWSYHGKIIPLNESKVYKGRSNY